MAALPRFAAILPLLLLPLGCGGSSQPSASADFAPQRTERLRIEPSKVVFAMRGHERDFRVCFFKAPNQRGAVRVGFDVDDQGIVQKAKLMESTIGKNEVEACLLTQTEALRFGSLRAPAQGEWTFVFRLTEPLSDKEREQLLAEDRDGARDANEEQDEPAVVVESSSQGRLAIHEIEETIEVGFPLFARCYRDALNRRDRRGGSVKFRLAIDAAGRVEQLTDAGSKMPDPLAIDCIAEGFYAMNFPAPSGGPVNATYRLELD